MEIDESRLHEGREEIMGVNNTYYLSIQYNP
jgi:hypothetical protein